MDLHDVINIHLEQTNAAIVVEQGLSKHALVSHYMPTLASLSVFEHFCKAVLPNVTQEQRAINLYGSYGSGKSHLAVVLAQLLRDGAHAPGFETFLERLRQIHRAPLAETLKHTYLAKSDADFKPYLLVSLYASGTTSLGAKLMEGLYDALERHPDLDVKEILPSTEYEVCVKRFEEIIEKEPAYTNADLSVWNLEHFLSTEDLLFNLKGHQPKALQMFLKWHEQVCFGQSFNIKDAGGKNFIEAYYEAGKNLAEKYRYSGIAVVWDEFGNALEDLIGNASRNAGQEIIDLQRFVETVCAPDLGHTLFIGVTHVSFEEYGDRTHAAEVIKEGLAKISGRFYKPFKIELNASESEGYHLLGMQKSWTENGKALIAQNQPARQRLLDVCRKLPLFNPLHEHLQQVVNEVYPLHPVMAVGLFNLSRLAQVHRTALTFFRDNAAEILNREVSDHELWKSELLRLPRLVTYYADNLQKQAGSDWRRYEQAVGQVSGNAEEVRGRQNILRILLLAQLLGENFKASDELLACALYDAEPNTPAAEPLHQNLAWLKGAGLVWKNPVTQYWQFAGEGGVDVEKLIEKQLSAYVGRTVGYLLENYLDMREDLLPILGEHDLEPSSCGIIRSYRVETLTPPFSHEQLKLTDPLLSARVFLVLAKNLDEVQTAKARIQESAKKNVFFWLPALGIDAESVTENNTVLKLNDLLCRYLAINQQLKQDTALSEDLRRQLEAKGENNRQAVIGLLQNLFGRAGLDAGKCQVYQAGSSEPLNCKSWHGFREWLAHHVGQSYRSEVPIRAMNMNMLRKEKYYSHPKVLTVVERIIEFDDNPTYRTDLLGEDKETSESSALIDGILGANQLFIKRASGWDIKRVDEAEGVLRDLLKLIHDTLLRKRESPYPVAELRNKLVSEPYGIPACTLPIFAAVAIRHEQKRLRWGSTNEKDFAKNLVSAFEKDSKLTIRLYEFSTKQFAMLFLVGQCLGIKQAEGQPNEEYAAVCASKLREFVNSKPDSVKASNKLSVKTRQLVDFLNKPGKTAQDLAESLIDLLDAKNDLPQANVTRVIAAIRDLLNDFLKVENAKLHELKQSWEAVYPTSVADKQKLTAGLARIGMPHAHKLAEKFDQTERAEDIDVKELLPAILGKRFDDCSDSDIGRFDATVKLLFEQAKQPDPDKIPPVIPDSPIDPVTPSMASTPDKLEAEIRKLIAVSTMARAEVRKVLEQLLSSYGD